MSKRWLFRVLGAGALAFVVSAASAQSAAPDEILVRYRSGATPSTRAMMASAVMGRVLGSEPRLNTDRIQLSPSVPVAAALALLQNDPRILYAEPNYIVKTFASPNDPLYNTSQYAPQITQANLAWDKWTPAADAILAIVDTGVDMTHEDLVNRLYRINGAVVGTDCANGDSDPTDDHGHGTHCAGIAAAEGNNGKGVAGVGGWTVQGNSFGVKIMPVKVLDSTGSGYISTVAQGVVWAADHGANVISMSLGSSSNSSTLASAINYAYGKGIVVVAAAGNNGNTTPSYPGANDHVLSVGSTDQTDTLSSFSNYGTWVLTAAPGSGIMSTYKGGSYGFMSGTSMATPFVAGEAALLKAQSPSLTNDQIVSLIVSNVDTIATGAGHTIKAGAGRVNVLKALNALINQAPTPHLTSATYTPSSVLGGSAASLQLQLSAAAPADGLKVNLVSSSTSVVVPVQASFPAGITSVTVPVTTSAVTVSTDTITNASLGGDTLHATLTLTPPAAPRLTSISFDPASVQGGNGSVLHVLLSGPAPVGGMTVRLSSSSSSMSLPASATVAAGASSANVNVSTLAVTSTASAVATATLANDTKTASLTLTAPPLPRLAAVSFDPSTVLGGNSSVLHLQLSGAAPAGGMAIQLSSNSASLKLPASATVAAGSTSVNVTATTLAVTAAATATATATLGADSLPATLALTAPPLPTLSGASFDPASVVGGKPSALKLQLSGPAPAGGMTVALSSNNSSLTVPASVKFAAGSQLLTVSVTTKAVTALASAAASAKLGSATLNANISLSPAPVVPKLTALRFLSTSLTGGKGATLHLELSVAAPEGGTTVALTSSSSSLVLPARASFPQGTRTLDISATTSAVSKPTSVYATGTLGTTSLRATLSLVQAAPTLVSVTLPSPMLGNKTYTASVTLSGNALPDGLLVTLQTQGGLTAPASVKVPAGASRVTFTVKTPKVTTTTSVSISAAAGDQRVTSESSATASSK